MRRHKKQGRSRVGGRLGRFKNSMGRILVIYYTQTGQLRRIARSMLEPLAGRQDVEVVWHEVVPKPAYPFPWKFLSFLDAFPESVYLDPPSVAQGDFDADAPYDLVILAYQVWFLAPSLPVMGFLASPKARVLKGKRVITVIACRNMWTMAHRAMTQKLRALGAHLADNVVFTDQGPLWSTFITTPWWLLTGNQGPLFNVLPKAGVSDQEISRAARFGHALADALPRIRSGAPGPYLAGLGAVKVNPLTMLAERVGHRSFRVWGALMRAVGGPGNALRKPLLLVYAFFLVGAIILVLPLTLTIAAIASRLSQRVAVQALELEAPTGSSGERLALYDSH
ncbi:MAG: dialkylresorcinol condensing enzyme [Burkholderiales bacterium]